MKIKNKDDRNPVPKEVLAEAIIDISNAVYKLTKSGINKKCVIDLVYLQTKISRKTIKLVLDGLEELKETYCADNS